MLIPFWFVLFTTSCLANVLGLNISSAFNSAVTVYVMIPLLLIPQMILSGLLFNFDKLNDIISTKGRVPLLADMMASRWAYEAMAVYQFKNNKYEAPYYTYEKVESQSDFNSSFLIDELNKRRKFIGENIADKNDSVRYIMSHHLEIIQNTLRSEPFYKKGLEELKIETDWTLENFTPEFDGKLENYLNGFRKFYQDAYNRAVAEREKKILDRETAPGSDYKLNDFKNQYHNESLADVVTNISEKERIIEFNGRLFQQINPIFVDPRPEGVFDYRAHFFAPKKYLFGVPVETYWFNVLVIWIMTLFLYITLYFELLRKLVDSFDSVPGKVNLKIVGTPKKK
jgi:hypothetical protein